MHDPPKPPVRYESYLMRLRWVERDGQQTCQAMLTSVTTKEQRYFNGLESLVAFLQTQAQTARHGEPTRILIADHDPRVRAALQMLLGQNPEWVVGENSDVESMVKQIREFKPDLLLLDWEMPGCPAAALLLALKKLKATPKVIALSRRPESEAAALRAGADAFVSKANPPEEVLEALRTLAKGR